MKTFVLTTGILNILFPFLFFYPPFYIYLFGFNVQAIVLSWLLAIPIIYTGIILVISSRDLVDKAIFVYWEGWFRFILAMICIVGSLFGGLCSLFAIIGFVEILIGLVYVIGLRKYGYNFFGLTLEYYYNFD